VGMNRVISYNGSEPFCPTEKQLMISSEESNRYHLMAENDFTTTGMMVWQCSEYMMEHRNRVEVGL
jgi:predicted DCC family thiol-disulfide oxidoreductase YuxK